MGEVVLQKLQEAAINGKGILYVRNHTEKIELEIVRSTGKYSVDVLGE
jgi:hypothetical protein